MIPKNRINRGSKFWHEICYKFYMRMKRVYLNFSKGGENRGVRFNYGKGKGQLGLLIFFKEV